MTARALAHGLASLGRHGDSMLMHVSPREVAGLQSVAHMVGRPLTKNPHTGMPEAFDFGDFITNMLPTAVAIMLAPETGGTSLAAVPETMAANVASTAATTAATNAATQVAMAPIIGGMATGAAVAGAKGENPLIGAGLGAFSGYSAQGLNNVFGNMAKGVGSTASTAGGAPIENAIAATANDAPMLSQQIGGANLASSSGSGLSNMFDTGVANLKNAGSAISNFATHPLDTYKQFTGAGGTGKQLLTTFGVPAAMAATEDFFPEPVDMSDEEAKRKKEAEMYKGTNGYILNLSPDSGLRLAAGGAIPGSGKIFGTQAYQQDSSNVYNTPDGTAAQNTPSESYGIARLDNLFNQGASAKAANEFYAEGGPIAFSEGGLGSIYAKGGYLDGQGDGMSDSIPASIEGQQPARLADGEFVVPADVVSHIGNGSSKAGAQRLYSMLHKVRKARTGNPKQGKQINPNKYLPA